MNRSELKIVIPTLVGFLVLTALIVVGKVFGYQSSILLLAALTLTTAIYLVYASLAENEERPDMSLEEALHFAAPTTEEEEKRAVLRALNDLQFERSVGKISEEDYQEGSKEYRAQASRLIARADESLAERKAAAEERLRVYLANQAASKDEAEA